MFINNFITKICAECKIEKLLVKFPFEIKTKYYRNKCTMCRSEEAKKRRLINPESRKISSRKYMEKNRELIKEKSRKYSQKNKDKIRKRHKKYWEENKSIITEKNKIYRIKNLEILSKNAQQYREVNKQQISYRRKDNYQKNKEIIKEQRKNYYAKKSDLIKKRVSKYRKNNPDKVRNINRKWFKQNIDKSIESNRKWRKNNPTTCYIMSNNVRMLKYHAQGKFTLEDYELLWEIQKGLCNICFIKMTINKRCKTERTIDHKIALKDGGTNWPDNIQLLCRSCNCKKGSKEMRARKGYI
jgi:hypothetical protein